MYIGLVFGALSGILQSLTYPPYNLWWLSPFAIAIIFWLIRNNSPRVALVSSAAYGLTFFMVNLSWVYRSAMALMGNEYLLIALICSAFETVPLLFAVLAITSLGRLSNLNWAIGISILWCIQEWLRSIGPLGLTFSMIGTPQIESWSGPAIASVFGVHGLTFLVCLVASSLVLFADPKSRRSGISGLAMAMIVVLSTGQSWGNNVRETAFRTIIKIVQIGESTKSDFSRRMLRARLLTDLTEHSLSDSAALVVWPESAIEVANGTEYQSAIADAQALSKELSASLVLGISGFSGARDFNAALNISDADKQNYTLYLKRQLVPFAEFVPMGSTFRRLRALKDLPDMIRGSQSGRVSAGNIILATLICYDAGSSELFHDDHGADAYVVISDDSWFIGRLGVDQHLQQIRLRAAEQGASIVVASAIGPSGIVDRRGKWRIAIPQGKSAAATVLVGPRVWTAYSRYGDLLAVALILVVATIGASISMMRRHVSHSPEPF